MTGLRRAPGDDPRTLARDIPGLLDTLFPHLLPGVVAHLNRSALPAKNCHAVPFETIQSSSLARPMLFELAFAAAEQLLTGRVDVDWGMASSVAGARQRRHFDARVPTLVPESDTAIALQVARNLVIMLASAQAEVIGCNLVSSPAIPGYQWIASGVGDFAVGDRLIEVKCTGKRFSSADYRQVLMYWLLSYAGALEGKTPEWSHMVLLNPRLAITITLSFDDLIRLLAGGKSKVELLELFTFLISERELQC